MPKRDLPLLWSLPGLALALALGVGLLSAPPARALPEALEAAKDQGRIGEQADGYLGVRTDVSPEVRSLLDEVNAQRRQAYAELAKERGVARSDVAKVTAVKLIDREPSGHWVRGADGTWLRKP